MIIRYRYSSIDLTVGRYIAYWRLEMLREQQEIIDAHNGFSSNRKRRAKRGGHYVRRVLREHGMILEDEPPAKKREAVLTNYTRIVHPVLKGYLFFIAVRKGKARWKDEKIKAILNFHGYRAIIQ